MDRGVVVLGMHRSGTSCLTGALSKCGISPGQSEQLTNPNFENPKGFYELKSLRNFCDSVLHSMNCDWWKVESFSHEKLKHDEINYFIKQAKKIYSEVSINKNWVIKEPRLSFLLPLLLRVFGNPVVIHIVRNPVEVAKSLKLRNGFSISHGVALWEAYNREIIGNCKNLNYLRVNYNDLQIDSIKTMEWILKELKNIGFDNIHLSNDEVENFVESSLQHEKVSDQLLENYLTKPQIDFWNLIKKGYDKNIPALPDANEYLRETLLDLENKHQHYIELSKLRIQLSGITEVPNGIINNVTKNLANKMDQSFDEKTVLFKKISKIEQNLKKCTDEINKKEELNIKLSQINKLFSLMSDTFLNKNLEIEELKKAIISKEKRINDLIKKLEIKEGEIVLLTNMVIEKEKLLERSNNEFSIINDIYLNYNKKYQKLLFKLLKEKKYINLIENSELFDEKFYLAQNEDVKKTGIVPVKHYLLNGGFEGRDPCSGFKSKLYLERYRDVKEIGMNPLVHFLLFGKAEGRKAN